MKSSFTFIKLCRYNIFFSTPKKMWTHTNGLFEPRIAFLWKRCTTTWNRSYTWMSNVLSIVPLFLQAMRRGGKLPSLQTQLPTHPPTSCPSRGISDKLLSWYSYKKYLYFIEKTYRITSKIPKAAWSEYTKSHGNNKYIICCKHNKGITVHHGGYKIYRVKSTEFI